MPSPLILEPPLKKRKPYQAKEYAEQCFFFTQLRYRERHQPEVGLIFATLNGIRLTPGLARKAKLAGNKAGVPDVVVPIARGGFFGLYIEFKEKDGAKPPKHQLEFHQALREQGYSVVVAYGHVAQMDALNAYMKLPRTMVIPFASHDEKMKRG